ncbi:MAG: acyl-CoA dehydrogenase family protein [Acidimicrobiales bacterium]
MRDGVALRPRLPCAEAANTAKFLAAEAGYQAADQAVQTLGGMGYASEYHVERYWREASCAPGAGEARSWCRPTVATHVLGLPRSY